MNTGEPGDRHSHTNDLAGNRPDEQTEQHTVSRRAFLKMAGAAGAIIGVGSGLGGLLAACGAESTQTTGGAATTAGATATSVGAGAEQGDEIIMGFVSPLTGPLAPFGVPDKYCADRWREAVADGIVSGDGKKHPVRIEVLDSQSDSNRAAQVAGDLINNTKVDIMMVASTPDTVTPVVEQCEANGMPVVSADCPYQTYLGQRDKYKWSYHAFWGAEDYLTQNWAVFDQLQTNKQVGGMFDNSADGNFFGEQIPIFLRKKGYTMADTDHFQTGQEDFTAQITAFKKSGVELIAGNMAPPDFTNFIKQAFQQGLQTQLRGVQIGRAVLFPQSVEAVGDIANGLIKELWWHPTWPFKSSLSGETCQELADDFEKRNNMPPTAPLLHYVVGEMAIYAMRNAADPKNKDAVIAAVEAMKLDTSIVGPIDFTADILPDDPEIGWKQAGPGRKHHNVYCPGLGGAQWLMQGGKHMFDEVPVDKTVAPFMLDSTIQPVKPLPIS